MSSARARGLLGGGCHGSFVRRCFTLIGSIPIIGPILALAAWVVIARTIRKSPLRQGKHDELAGGTRVVQLQAG